MESAIGHLGVVEAEVLRAHVWDGSGGSLEVNGGGLKYRNVTVHYVFGMNGEGVIL